MKPHSVHITEDFAHKGDQTEEQQETEWNQQQLDRQHPAATDEPDISCQTSE